MRTPRLYHPMPLAADSRVELAASAAKHLLIVLRLKPGAALVLFDGSGNEFDARLEEPGKKSAWVAVTGRRESKVESPLVVTLAQGVSRGERMDYTVQKAVELGVAGIIPVLMERSVVKLDAENIKRKQEHWQSVVIGACEQSGRVRVPPVQPPQNFGAFLDGHRSGGLGLLLDPLAKHALKDLPSPKDGRVLLLVGPEGGLSEVERKMAQSAGFQGIRLGPRILRTETAALVALSLLQASWGDLD
ncbi:MAG TPA: 16S rRNA (uracil(1498)-N(3))-methyltransferase [Gammaproteobacteria bacterium]|nr:16S rRNA (uracil(1498)-N(3))-methyltransferase [Gammaproteobacteria bacterium]